MVVQLAVSGPVQCVHKTRMAIQHAELVSCVDVVQTDLRGGDKQPATPHENTRQRQEPHPPRTGWLNSPSEHAAAMVLPSLETEMAMQPSRPACSVSKCRLGTRQRSSGLRAQRTGLLVASASHQRARREHDKSALEQHGSVCGIPPGFKLSPRCAMDEPSTSFASEYSPSTVRAEVSCS